MQENSTLIIQLEDYSSYLDQNYRNFCDGLRKLPPKNLLQNKSLSEVQYLKWTNDEISWQWIAFRLAYFLIKRTAQATMPDPLDCQTLDEVSRKYIDTVSRLFLAELDLIVEGWKIIKSTALEVRGYFPFDYPSELFGDVCRFRAEDDTSAIFTNETISEVYISKICQGLREESRLFRNGFDTKKTSQKLASYKVSGDWVYFAIYSIWDYRERCDHKYLDLTDAWKRFLKSHKKYVAMYCNKDFFKDVNVSINTYIYTRDGRILTNFNRRMLEAKSINGSVVFY